MCKMWGGEAGGCLTAETDPLVVGDPREGV